MYGAVLIIVLTALGGVIAYVGDWIGRRVGRQRLTLFGLRPKYTSIVIAVITGVMVVGTTLAALIIVDNDFREMLVDYGSVKTQLVTTQGSLSSTQQQLSHVEGQLDEKLRELAQKEEDIVKLVKQVEPLKEQIEDLNDQIEEKTRTNEELQRANEELGERVDELGEIVSARERELGDAEEKLKRADERLADVQEHFDKASADLQKTQADLDGTKAELETAQADRDKAKAELDDARVQLADAQRELADAKVELDDVSDELSSTKLDLESKKTDLDLAQNTIADLQAEIGDLTNEIDDLARERGDLEAERDALRSERDALRSERDALRIERDQLSSDKTTLGEEVNDLQDEINDLQAERDRLSEEIDELSDQLEDLDRRHRFATTTFGGQVEQYEELLTLYGDLLTIAVGGTVTELKGALIHNAVLEPGDAEELNRYLAQVGQAIKEDLGKGFRVVRTDLDAAQAAIANATDKALVRVSLAENVYEDDRLTTDILASVTVDERSLVFDKNEIIAWSGSPITPGDSGTHRIYEALAEVGQAAREKALEKGVYVLEDGTVGVDVGNTVDEVVRKIEEFSEPVRLYMKADEDFFNTDSPIDWSFGFMPERQWREWNEKAASYLSPN